MTKHLTLILSLLTLTACPDGRTLSLTVEAVNGQDGLDGAKGDQGEAGTNGINGLSAYELAALDGYTGTLEEWISDLAGDSSLPVLLCHNDSNTHKEYGIITNGELFALFHSEHASGISHTYWTQLIPNTTYRTTTANHCTFTYNKVGDVISIKSGSVTRTFDVSN